MWYAVISTGVPAPFDRLIATFYFVIDLKNGAGCTQEEEEEENDDEEEEEDNDIAKEER